MPFEPNKQTTVSIDTSSSRRPNGFSLGVEDHGPHGSSPSAARRAAEAAFLAPARPDAPASPSAQVTVRRRRVIVAQADGAAAAGAGQASEAAVAAASSTADGKGQRIFRLDTAPAADSVPAPGAADGSAGPPPHDRVPRSRRIAIDRRPGAVVHLVQRVLPVQAPAAAAPPNRLAEALAPVGALLDAIVRAQAFQVDDGAIAEEWQRLSRRADALARELQKRLRPAGRTRPTRAG